MENSAEYKIKHPEVVTIAIQRLENVTSKTMIVGEGARKPYSVEFVAFGDGQVTVCVPEKLLNLGHTVDLVLETHNHFARLELHSRGKVIKIQSGDEGYLAVNIQLHKYDDKLFKRMCGVFQEIQADVDTLFHQVRGY